MKLRAMIVPAVLIIAVVTGGLAVSCKRPSQPPPTPTPTPVPTPTPQPPVPSGTVDLLLGQVRLERYSDPNYNYQIIATIKNVGSGDATSFSAGCTYKCPPGEQIISAGLDIVQGGYIAANDEFTYKEPFRYTCTARPPTINLDCIINPKDGPPRQHMITVPLP